MKKKVILTTKFENTLCLTAKQKSNQGILVMGVHCLTNTFHPSKPLQISLYFVDSCCHDMCSTCGIHLIKDTILKQSSLVSSDKNVSLFRFRQVTKLPTGHSRKAMCSTSFIFKSRD